MRELREQSWIASMPLGFATLEREAGEFFLRSKAFTFPGLKIAEIFGIDDGPLYEEIRRNILHINGADHGAPARARQPRLHPARGREVAAGDARLPRGAVGRASRASAAATPSPRSASPTRAR